MAEKMTIDDVIEAHRKETGATEVHVTLGPVATAEGLEECLRELRRREAIYASFSELEQERAKTARHEGILRDIAKFCQFDLRDTQASIDLEARNRLNQIFSLVDMVPDVDLETDTVWMADQRARKGLDLPSGVTSAQIYGLRCRVPEGT